MNNTEILDEGENALIVILLNAAKDALSKIKLENELYLAAEEAAEKASEEAFEDIRLSYFS